jgi:hypothetical protein
MSSFPSNAHLNLPFFKRMNKTLMPPTPLRCLGFFLLTQKESFAALYFIKLVWAIWV